MAKKKALITGVTGQDGAYLAELLLAKGDKAREKLGWRHKITFAQLVREMVQADLKAVALQRDRRDWHG